MKNLLTKGVTGTLLGLTILFILSACKEETPPPVQRIRAIKTITVSERASGLVRRFSGIVEAVDKSSLSFEVSGNIRDLKVKVGDRVEDGQIIATLDKRPFELNVQAAQTEVERATVGLRRQKREFERLMAIYKIDPGAVSQRILEQAEATYEGAGNTVSYTKTQLNLARLDLQKTELSAPFNGVIAKRHVEPFQEVSRGQPIFDIFIEGAMDAVINVPETIIKDIFLGLPGEIRLTNDPGKEYRGIVTEISSVADSASTFPVKVIISDAADKIRPGMSAEVRLLMPSADQESSFLIPIHAFIPGDKESETIVFILDSETSTVKKAAVEAESAFDNNIVVTSGLKPGDIVAVAGVSYLRNGQKVKLMTPE